MICPKLDDRDSPFGKILLIPQVLIRDHENLKTGGFRCIEKFTILTALPSQTTDRRGIVTGQCVANLHRDAFVEKHLHASSRSICFSP